MSPSPHARREDANGVITVTFTRDDKLNAVSPEMFGALEEAVRDLAERDEHRVLVITGEGRYFTAGLDIGGLQGPLGEGTDGVVPRAGASRSVRRDRADREAGHPGCSVTLRRRRHRAGCVV